MTLKEKWDYPVKYDYWRGYSYIVNEMSWLILTMYSIMDSSRIPLKIKYIKNYSKILKNWIRKLSVKNFYFKEGNSSQYSYYSIFSESEEKENIEKRFYHMNSHISILL